MTIAALVVSGLSLGVGLACWWRIGALIKALNASVAAQQPVVQEPVGPRAALRAWVARSAAAGGRN